MDPYPTVDPTSFFIDFKDANQAHHLQSKKLNFLLKFCGKILFYSKYFSPLNTSMRKGRIRIREAQKHADPDLVSDPDPQHWQKVMDSDLGSRVDPNRKFF
jgi:hypothetical protein